MANESTEEIISEIDSALDAFQKNLNALEKDINLQIQISNVYREQAATFASRLHFEEIISRNLSKENEALMKRIEELTKELNEARNPLN